MEQIPEDDSPTRLIVRLAREAKNAGFAFATLEEILTIAAAYDEVHMKYKSALGILATIAENLPEGP